MGELWREGEEQDCRGCGGALVHDPGEGTYHCPACGATFHALCIDCGVPFNGGAAECRECLGERAAAESPEQGASFPG